MQGSMNVKYIQKLSIRFVVVK